MDGVEPGAALTRWTAPAVRPAAHLTRPGHLQRVPFRPETRGYGGPGLLQGGKHMYIGVGLGTLVLIIILILIFA
jgi:hypothetical protein